MTDQELKTLAQAMHELEYVVPGNITEFDMEFSRHVAHVEFDGETYRLLWISEKED